MKIYELDERVVEVLQRKGRLSNRALKVDFSLDEATLDALKEELFFTCTRESCNTSRATTRCTE